MFGFLEFICPPCCPLCRGLYSKREICDSCLDKLIFLDTDFFSSELNKQWFNRARSVVAYEAGIAEAIHSFKYSFRFDFVECFSTLLYNHIKNISLDYDFIIPVPMHWIRLIKRGFNQSAVLCKTLGQKTEIKVQNNILKKKRNIHPQVGLTKKQRIHNVVDVFQINSKYIKTLQNKKILLIDDVMTTGATINECAKVLVKKGKCGKVDVLTISRTI